MYKIFINEKPFIITEKDVNESRFAKCKRVQYDALKIIEASNFPYILLEQVPGFMSSEAYAIMETKLRKWGYSVHKNIMDSRDYGGLTSRKRFYMFATSFETDFAWPETVQRNESSIWEEYILSSLPRLRDVTHSESIQDGAACGRLRVINKDSVCSPTFLKSQDRMAKDSVVVELEGRYYFPDIELMKTLMEIPTSFSTEAVSLSQGCEIIGQSVDFAMHTQIVQSVKHHVELVKASLCGKKQLSCLFRHNIIKQKGTWMTDKELIEAVKISFGAKDLRELSIMIGIPYPTISSWQSKNLISSKGVAKQYLELLLKFKEQEQELKTYEDLGSGLLGLLDRAKARKRD